MLRGPLGQPGVKTRFAGHETFPLRRLWLRKAYDAVCEDSEAPAPEYGCGDQALGARVPNH